MGKIDITEVRELAQILSDFGLTELEYIAEQSSVVLKKESVIQKVQSASVVQEIQVEQEEKEVESPHEDFNDLKEVKSPFVGVYYSAASPDSLPFVSIGTEVKKGDVLCIIESMKIMNEITAEEDGKIIDIAVKNGEIVEFGQVLFKLI